MDALKARPSIEISVETYERYDLAAFHHGNVNGIASRESGAVLANFRGAEHVGFLDGKNLVHDIQDYFDRRGDRVTAIDRGETVKDLLHYFRIGHESFSGGYQAFEQELSLNLVRMRRAHKVHGYVRIDENQPW